MFISGIYLWDLNTFVLQHDKTNKVTVRPAKTQISLGIHAVWSESSLSAWRKLGSWATHYVHSEDSDQTGRMPRLIWVFAEHTCHFVDFVMRQLIYQQLMSASQHHWALQILQVVQVCPFSHNEWLCVTWCDIMKRSWTHILKPHINLIWTASSEFGTYHLCEQQRFRRACASAQSRQNLRCSLIQAVSQEEPSDRKPDPWPLWMAGHAQLKLVMMECSKTQIRLTGPIYDDKAYLVKFFFSF